MGKQSETFPPGDYLREEIEARGWTREHLAARLNLPPSDVEELFAGRLAVTSELARLIADALGTSADVWLNLEVAYRRDHA